MIVIKIKSEQYTKTEKWENLLKESLQKNQFEWNTAYYFLWSALLIVFVLITIRLLNISLLTEIFVLFGHCVMNTLAIFILICLQKRHKQKASFPIYSNAMPLSSGITRNDTIVHMTTEQPEENMSAKYKDLSPHSFKTLMKKELRSQMDNKTYSDLIGIVDEWPTDKVLGLMKLCERHPNRRQNSTVMKAKSNSKNPKVPMLSLSSNKSDETSNESPCASIDLSKLISHRKVEKWKQRTKDYRPTIPGTKEENWQWWFFSGDCSTADIVQDSSSKDKSDPSSEWL